MSIHGGEQPIVVGRASVQSRMRRCVRITRVGTAQNDPGTFCSKDDPSAGCPPRKINCLASMLPQVRHGEDVSLPGNLGDDPTRSGDGDRVVE